MKAPKWLAALFLLTGLFGCAHVQEYVDMARSDSLSAEYVEALNTYTQEKTVYSEFETRIRVVATWKSREFRDAYRSEYARLYDLPASAGDEMRGIRADSSLTERQGSSSTERQGSSSELSEFLFYAYVPDRQSNDFSKADSLWKVFCVQGGGQRVEPLEIREIETTPLVTKFFPYVKPYGKFYSVQFPLESPSQREDGLDKTGPTLVVTGIPGKVELKWHVRNP
jgi:hypothetical protein